MNGAVFKTVSETVRTGSGRFDSYTPPPANCGMLIGDFGFVAMNADDMKKRTRVFALRVIRLAESLPNSPTAIAIRNQMLRCGPSVGANYRAACRARSRRDFVAKMGIVEEEADETIYWIELLIDADLIERKRVTDLLQESAEILSIVVSSIKTARIDGTKSLSKSAIRNPQSEIL